MIEMPKFMNSEYFVEEFGNWHLKDGAPPDVVKEFDEYMKAEAEANEQGEDR